jgi:hypothetical protein
LIDGVNDEAAALDDDDDDPMPKMKRECFVRLSLGEPEAKISFTFVLAAWKVPLPKKSRQKLSAMASEDLMGLDADDTMMMRGSGFPTNPMGYDWEIHHSVPGRLTLISTVSSGSQTYQDGVC